MSYSDFLDFAYWFFQIAWALAFLLGLIGCIAKKLGLSHAARGFAVLGTGFAADEIAYYLTLLVNGYRNVNATAALARMSGALTLLGVIWALIVVGIRRGRAELQTSEWEKQDFSFGDFLRRNWLALLPMAVWSVANWLERSYYVVVVIWGLTLFFLFLDNGRRGRRFWGFVALLLSAFAAMLSFDTVAMPKILYRWLDGLDGLGSMLEQSVKVLLSMDEPVKIIFSVLAFATPVLFAACALVKPRVNDKIDVEWSEKQRRMEEEKRGNDQTVAPVRVDSELYVNMTSHVLLLIFTCGIWQLIWIYRVTKGLNCFPDEEERDPGKKLLLCLFVPGYSAYWAYKTARRVDKLGRARGVEGSIANVALLLACSWASLPPYSFRIA